MFRLDGRVALITGSTRGLGWAIAEAFAAQGAHVVVNGREPATVTARVDELHAAGHAANGLALDVAVEGAASRVVDAVVAEHGRLDILVNNAGIQRRGPVVGFSTEDFDAVLTTNLRAPFLLAQAAAAVMVTAGWGRIINVASTMSVIARPGVPAYVTSKTGLVGTTRALAVELAAAGVTVNAIGPGYIVTELNTALLADPEFTAMVERRTPVGRWGRPEEVAGAAVFLASDEASYVTGHHLMVDGGMTVAV